MRKGPVDDGGRTYELTIAGMPMVVRTCTAVRPNGVILSSYWALQELGILDQIWQIY